jgi:hypothetical protein
VPTVLAVVTIVAARLPADEIAHPLDILDEVDLDSAELAPLEE